MADFKTVQGTRFNPDALIGVDAIERQPSRGAAPDDLTTSVRNTMSRRERRMMNPGT